MRLTEQQRGVLTGMATGMATTLGGVGTALWAAPEQVLPHGGLFARLTFWSGWALPVVVTLLLFVALLARHRFHSPEDIDGGGLSPGSPQARIYQAVLQNTLEQSVLWLAVTVLWAIRMPGPTLAVLPLSAILFVIGRALFLHGYGRGAPGRALGFALTFYPSVVMMIILIAEGLGVPFE